MYVMNDKKLSCRRQSARWFVSLNISLCHSRSFRYKVRYWSKVAFFHTLALDALVRGVPVLILSYHLVWKN